MRPTIITLILFILGSIAYCQQESGEINFEPFIWKSQPPSDCPFEQSEDLTGILFTGRSSNYWLADTWYFSWASDEKLYSPYTDGSTPRFDTGRDASISWREPFTTGQAVAEGDDPGKYEFFGGYDESNNPVWTKDFEAIKPMIDWNNNCGCVTITYNEPLQKYIISITNGWPTVEKMDTYILESDQVTGPWKLVTYMEDFGEQGYFVNFPTKFISSDGRTAWICYSGNFATDWRDMRIEENPPGSHYGLVLQEIEFLRKK